MAEAEEKEMGLAEEKVRESELVGDLDLGPVMVMERSRKDTLPYPPVSRRGHREKKGRRY